MPRPFFYFLLLPIPLRSFTVHHRVHAGIDDRKQTEEAKSSRTLAKTVRFHFPFLFRLSFLSFSSSSFRFHVPDCRLRTTAHRSCPLSYRFDLSFLPHSLYRNTTHRHAGLDLRHSLHPAATSPNSSDYRTDRPTYLGLTRNSTRSLSEHYTDVQTIPTADSTTPHHRIYHPTHHPISTRISTASSPSRSDIAVTPLHCHHRAPTSLYRRRPPSPSTSVAVPSLTSGSVHHSVPHITPLRSVFVIAEPALRCSTVAFPGHSRGHLCRTCSHHSPRPTLTGDSQYSSTLRM
jgi:hypothetical protein